MADPTATQMTLAQVKTLVSNALAKAAKELDERTAAGLCYECDEPIARSSEPVYGHILCARHSREAELEALIEEQEEEAKRERR